MVGNHGISPDGKFTMRPRSRQRPLRFSPMPGRLRVVLAFLAAFSVVCSAAAAADVTLAPQRVVKNEVALTVRPDGVLHARESVTYDFADGGNVIARRFVTKTRDNDRRDRVFKVANLKAASADGGPATVTASADGDFTIVRISGPRVTGAHTTVLEYDVHGAFSSGASGQELRWTALGGWQVPVSEARVTVDSAAVIRNLNCFAGELTSSVGCTQFFTNHTHSRGEFVQQNLFPREYLTIAIGYPPGTTSGTPLYERMLYAALFDGRDEIRLTQLGGTFAEQLARVRRALYEDVVREGWFARRPDAERTRWTTAGMILTAVGVVGTVLLALFTELALIGLAVIIAGAALTLGGQHMPAKTARGATVLAHTIGFRAYLYRGEAEDVPEDQRLSVFSRYLPYAVVFDAVQRWAKTVEDVGVREKGADNLYWYEGPAEWDLSKFAESMRIFTLATSGAISQARQFRSLS